MSETDIKPDTNSARIICPKCGGTCWATGPDHPTYPDSIVCKECGFLQKIPIGDNNE